MVVLPIQYHVMIFSTAKGSAVPNYQLSDITRTIVIASGGNGFVLGVAIHIAYNDTADVSVVCPVPSFNVLVG